MFRWDGGWCGIAAGSWSQSKKDLCCLWVFPFCNMSGTTSLWTPLAHFLMEATVNVVVTYYWWPRLEKGWWWGVLHNTKAEGCLLHLDLHLFVVIGPDECEQWLLERTLISESSSCCCLPCPSAHYSQSLRQLCGGFLMGIHSHSWIDEIYNIGWSGKPSGHQGIISNKRAVGVQHWMKSCHRSQIHFYNLNINSVTFSI